MLSPRSGYLLLGSLVAVIAALVWYLRSHPSVPSSASSPPAVSLRGINILPSAALPAATPDPLQVRALQPGPNGVILPPEAAQLARSLNAPNGTAEQDTQTLSTLVDLFRRANQGAIPAGGLNEEITEQMLGKNTQHFAVLPPDCPGLDASGRLLDRWGTPYFLHPLSREILEIRSAGPDRKMGTADDVRADESAGAGIRR